MFKKPDDVIYTEKAVVQMVSSVCECDVLLDGMWHVQVIYACYYDLAHATRCLK